MLTETTFQIGGIVTVSLAGALAIAAIWPPGDPDAGGLLVSAGLVAAFGLFFVHVGREARRARLDLLALGDPARPAADRPPPRP
ncbi:MAG TPA: hypothetical protein VMH78_02080 [Thermoplasmata archaeon]|nr:hypothetical protein [Thermoplasmata archaeon]